MRSYLWRIVGCEGRGESTGTQTRKTRNQWPTSGEADGTTTAGIGEAVHCWAPSQRWPHCRTWSLSIYVGCFCTCIIPSSFVLSYFFARISSFVIIDFLVCKGYCNILLLSFQIPDHERWRCVITCHLIFGFANRLTSDPYFMHICTINLVFDKVKILREL